METCQFKYLVRQNNISGHDTSIVILQAKKSYTLYTFLTKTPEKTNKFKISRPFCLKLTDKHFDNKVYTSSFFKKSFLVQIVATKVAISFINFYFLRKHIIILMNANTLHLML